MVAERIKDTRGKTFSDCQDGFEYLTEDFGNLSVIQFQVKFDKGRGVNSALTTVANNNG